MLSDIAPDSYHEFRPSSWILAEGEDAHEFLQSQFSNDISGLEEGESAYGLWLDQKGKVHGDSWILRTGDESFYLFSYFSSAEMLIEKLEKFIVADDVELEDQSADVVGLSLFGKAINVCHEIVGSDAIDFKTHQIPGRRGQVEAIDVVMAKSDLQVFLKALTGAGIVVSLNEDIIELQRILSELPRIPDDIGPGELPQEGGLEKVGVSFTKGCYLGQEVMSRLHSMGQARRSLRLIESQESIPYESELTAGGKRIGKSKTSTKYENRFVGLALISKAADVSTSFEIEGAGVGRVINQVDPEDG